MTETKRPQVSVIMCTFNRGELLSRAIRSVLAQDADGTPAFELLVVDNNSTDGTRRVIDAIAAEDSRVRYLFEPRQGLSFARNAAVERARAPLLAFTDDDVRVERNWAAAIVRAFEANPAADMVGGRVLPLWPAPPPPWLTRGHWAPLALVDHGDTALAITPARAICLVGANVAFRRGVFAAIGGFATEFQRVKEGIGSLEDHDFLLRMLRSGRTGVYDPRIIVHAEIQPNRLTRRYHRRWHSGHGHFHALLRSEVMEQSKAGRLFGVPAHLYRQAAGDVAGWLRAAVTRDAARTFAHEVRLRFFIGFFRKRCDEFRQRPRSERRGDRPRLRLLTQRRKLARPVTTHVGQERG